MPEGRWRPESFDGRLIKRPFTVKAPAYLLQWVTEYVQDRECTRTELVCGLFLALAEDRLRVDPGFDRFKEHILLPPFAEPKQGNMSRRTGK